MSNILNVYVKYFERVMTYFNGEDQPGRVCLEDFTFIGVHIGLGPPLLSQIIMVFFFPPRSIQEPRIYRSRRTCFYVGGRDGKIYIAELNAQTTSNNNNNYGLDIIGTLSDQSKAICSLGFALDGFQLVVGSEDGMVRVWDT
ncbi:unnamed protein product [Lactuca saligna]|uniref:Uncharacterized protein n=1 Tax=Lactuca saligna TaxID=75948 RepID=A0AA35VPT1_LACSI|nr:unnamed protein product [Lactuca saligna]